MFHSGTRAYLQIDFIIAMVLFFSFFFSITTYINAKEKMEEDHITNLLEQAFANDYCESLISSPGLPQNWEEDITTLVALGLKNSTNENLSTAKLAYFSNDYYANLLTFSSEMYNLDVTILGLTTATQYAHFGARAASTTMRASSSCYANYNDEVVQVLVEVWK
ncbi:hypothetical protein H6501_00150 [Candidatus Woesearchaeota archaeon]|nr:hypothetical protein [Nanoarchaeota archaeon]MCB9369993.1 hypothetical protein [Candidatus Woesearchaeota archaeon]